MALKSLKVIEIAGLAPAPFCGMLLSDFGANVIRVERPGQPPLDSLKRGKRNASIDLKHNEGKEIFKKLCIDADVLIEPFRPGVMERLGLGPKSLMDLNQRLVYARLSGFGQDGPYSKRAGHDINYLAISGALSLFTNNGKPVPPINILADFAGGGQTCVVGILVALLERAKSGLGQIVDVSMVEGVRYVSTYMWHTRKATAVAKDFIWPHPDKKEANLLDGGAHFYTIYETKDKRWISVGAIEPQFYAVLINTLNLNCNDYPQFELESWPRFKEEFANLFAQKTLEEWSQKFKDVDACVEPVLELEEASSKKASDLTKPYFNSDGTPMPAPKLSRTPAQPDLSEPEEGEHTAELLKEHGFSNEQIIRWEKNKVISCKINYKL